jgi:putative protease
MQRESVSAPLPAKSGGTGICLPELLAPAGDWDCAKAAVENGADAIYFGLERFNARMRASNFTEADLPKLLEYLHRRGVKGYITFNTLVFENELAEAEQYVRTMVAAGVDAAVVQDVGICRLIRSLSPDFPIHVSTQMTVTSAAGMAFARELGCDLVVLARECSLKEIEAIQAQFSGMGQRALPLEVFVHGALCVAYSGQCLTSEALGGRSANRGECAQACRMPYELISDGRPVPLGDRRYLLSPQDLAGIELLPALAKLGVASIKIEGRLKSPEYVANITRNYRAALDRLAAEASPEGIAEVSPQTRYELEMAFSRGLYTGWFKGTNNQELVHGRFGTKRGVYLGSVREVRSGGVLIGKLAGPVKPGDGVVFDHGHPEKPEEGGRVYEVIRRGDGLLLTFGRDDLNLGNVHVGDKLWKTSDPELERRLRATFSGDTPKFHRPVEMEVHGRAGTPLTLIVRDGEGHIARADSAVPLQVAEKHSLTPDRLREQLGRLGGTALRLGTLRSSIEGELMLPVSELNRVRREAVADLEAQRAQPKRWSLFPEAREGDAPIVREASAATAPEIAVLVRSMPQLEAALRSGVRLLYCEFEDPKRYREAVQRFRDFQSSASASDRALPGKPEIWVAPPRIFKMGEEWTLKQVRSSEADGYLVRNYDHLGFFAQDRRAGDYSLNVANHFAARYFRTKYGLEWITASYDLNFTQLEALLQGAPPSWFEITLHQHMPMFHMEHCVFCAFLSTGTDYRNCGRPCDQHELRLKDRVGAMHPVKADAGCRNTVFNALAQTGAEYAQQLVSLGVRRFRIEFLDETPEVVGKTIARYRQLLRGEIDGQALWRELKLMNQLGVTRGQIGRLAGGPTGSPTASPRSYSKR